METTKQLSKFKLELEYVVSIQSHSSSREVFLNTSLVQIPKRSISILPFNSLFRQTAFTIPSLEVFKDSIIVENLARDIIEDIIRIYQVPCSDQILYNQSDLILLHTIENPTLKLVSEIIGVPLI